MNKLRLLLQLLFFSNIAYAQVGYLDSIFLAENNPDSLEFLINEEIYYDSIFNSLESFKQRLNEFNLIQDKFDFKATNKTLNLKSYRRMAVFILENEIQSEFDFVLRHAVKYSVPNIYNVPKSGKNTSFVLTDILINRLSNFKKTEMFMRYILRSDFLEKNLNEEEIRLLGSIFSIRAGEEIINSLNKDKYVLGNRKLIKEAIRQ